MKLLILSPDAYSVFHQDTKFIFGGIEIETGHHAHGLSQLGMDVHVGTKDQGVGVHRIDGITLHPMPGKKGPGYWKKRTSFLGKIRYRLFKDVHDKENLSDFFARVRPDVGYMMGMCQEALQLARYCKKNGIPFVFRAAHDKDFGDESGSDKAMQDWTFMTMNEAREVISSASAVIAQTPYQTELFRSRFNRESELMFPPVVLDTDYKSVQKEFDGFWIGRTNSFKRPEVMVSIAKQLPDRKFCMVLNKASEEEWQQIATHLPENVTLVESVPAGEIDSYFRKARIFLSTSLHEGFPNTFLQAGKCGVPVISMGSDPNNMLTQHGAGVLAGNDQNAVCHAIEQLLSDPDVYNTASDAAKKYVETFHDRKVISKQLYGILTRKYSGT